MEIKKLSHDEIPELINLYAAIMPNEVEHKLEILSSLYQKIENNEDYIILVAKEDSQVVGTAMGVCCKTLAFGGKNFMVIEDVSVIEEFQRKGIGKKLFEALDEFALRRDCAYAILVSSGFRGEAHTFYEKMGYTEDVKGFRKMYTKFD